MNAEDTEVVKEFLIESNENLARLDQQLVALEQRPRDADLLAGIFRTFHTIKGTCGFLGFTTLEAVTHLAENILSQLRDGQRELTAELASLLLETIDAVRRILAVIETTQAEGADTYADLRARLEQAGENRESQKTAAPARTVPDNAGARASLADSTIRVDVGLLDRLMNLVGELVLARNQILQFTERREDGGFNATSQRLNLITTELQESVMKTRMQPIGVVWNKLPRVVRDLAASCGKQIHLDMDGAETGLDKTIIEAIKDPLTHIVRNSCDHGIERPEVRVKNGKTASGRLSLRAYHEGGHVNIEISDDGAGIDPERVKARAVKNGQITAEQAARMSEREAIHLVFLAGLSTAEKVTNVSGRGVGMDVVKTNIEKIGGVIDLSSRAGQGTTVRIRIPLTLAIIPGLVVQSGRERFVIPQVSLLELVRLEGVEGRKLLERIHATPVYRRRGSLLPLAYLNQVLRLDTEASGEIVNIVVLQAEDRQFGLVVDGIMDTQEIVVKPLGKQLKGLPCYAGATIMGDGRVALILDVMGVALASGVVSETREAGRRAEALAQEAATDRQALLLFRCGLFERLAVPLALVSRLEEFPRDRVERAGGRGVVQYRGRILPLIPLASQMNAEAPDAAGESGPLQVVVFSEGERSVGIMVDQIVDIVEDTVLGRRPAARPGLLGSGVVGKQVTDFLDLQAVIAASGEVWGEAGQSGDRDPARVLIAEASAFSRGMLRAGLEMAGYRVIEAAHGREAIEKLGKADLVLASLELAEEIRPELGDRPLIGLLRSAAERPSSPNGCNDYQVKSDRDAMLRSVEKLAAAVQHNGHRAPAEVHA